MQLIILEKFRRILKKLTCQKKLKKILTLFILQIYKSLSFYIEKNNKFYCPQYRAKMLNDKLYRAYKSKIFDKQLEDEQKFDNLRQTLVISQIMKCGKQILENIEMDVQEVKSIDYKNIYDQEYSTKGHKYPSKNQYGKYNSNQVRNRQQSFNSKVSDSHKYSNSIQQSDQQMDQISFTLSNQQTSKNYKSSKKYSQFHEQILLDDLNSKKYHDQINRLDNYSYQRNQPIDRSMNLKNNPSQSIETYKRLNNSQKRFKRTNSRQKNTNTISNMEIQNYLFNKNYQENNAHIVQNQNQSIQSIQVQSPIHIKQSPMLKKTFQSKSKTNAKEVTFVKSSSSKRKSIFGSKQKQNQSNKKSRDNDRSSYQNYQARNTNFQSRQSQNRNYYQDGYNNYLNQINRTRYHPQTVNQNRYYSGSNNMTQQHASSQYQHKFSSSNLNSNQIVINLDLRLVTPQRKKKQRFIPLSQKITKNVYGRLKQQVNTKNSIKQIEAKQYKTPQQTDMIWSRFIQRSQKWIDQKNNHTLERQMDQKYAIANQSNRKSQSPNKMNSFYTGQKEKNTHERTSISYKNTKPIHSKNQPNNERKQRQSSVQNYINKLKVQTQLLKVKLLNPMKKQLDIVDKDTEVQDKHPIDKNRKQFQTKNMLHKQKSIRNLRNSPGFSHIKNVYGNFIGQDQTDNRFK